MELFELETVGTALQDRCVLKTFACRNEVHKMRMTKDDAVMRGIEAVWKQDEKGGFVWEKTRVVISPSEIVVKNKRDGRKPEVIKEKTIVVHCMACGMADEIFIGGADSRLVEIAKSGIGGI